MTNDLPSSESTQHTKTLLIIFHAPSENTRRLMEAMTQSALSEEVESVNVTTLSPFNCEPKDILNADAIILGTPENLGYMSGALKDLFDRIYYPCLEKTQGKPYALFVRAGHDGTGTCRAVTTITTGLRWKEVQPPLVCRGDFQEIFIDQVKELGLLMSASIDAGII